MTASVRELKKEILKAALKYSPPFITTSFGNADGLSKRQKIICLIIMMQRNF